MKSLLLTFQSIILEPLREASLYPRRLTLCKTFLGISRVVFHLLCNHHVK